MTGLAVVKLVCRVPAAQWLFKTRVVSADQIGISLCQQFLIGSQQNTLSCARAAWFASYWQQQVLCHASGMNSGEDQRLYLLYSLRIILILITLVHYN